MGAKVVKQIFSIFGFPFSLQLFRPRNYSNQIPYYSELRSNTDNNHSVYTVRKHFKKSYGSHLIKQTKFGIVLFRVFAAGVGMFFHQENITLFNLKSKQHKSTFKKLYNPHYRHKKIIIKNQENLSNFSITHHSLDNIIWPCQFARPLTSRHTLPVFVNERNDVLYKKPNNTTETTI